MMKGLWIILIAVFLTACQTPASREAQEELERNYDQQEATIGVGTDPAEDPLSVPQLMRTPTP